MSIQNNRLSGLFANLLVLACFTLCSCATILESSKYKFADGTYTMQLSGSRKVYLAHHGDTTVVMPWIIVGKVPDTTQPMVFLPLMEAPVPKVKSPAFYVPTWDVDLVTIPFKYRPAVPGFPNQLNTTYNAAVYLGRRIDKYKLKYKRTPLSQYKRSVNHLGLSGGIFFGLGSTQMNEFVTNPAIDKQYDGLVFAKGIAVIGAVQNFSLGLTVGLDNLLDENREVWRYEGRVWVGIAIGINLN